MPDGPLVWACGDLHFENFGSFQGDNGLSYFDLNDFDESCLAPATWEVSRFVASAYVAAPSLNLTGAEANELVKTRISPPSATAKRAGSSAPLRAEWCGYFSGA